MRLRPGIDLAVGLMALGVAVAVNLSWREGLVMHGWSEGLTSLFQPLGQMASLPGWARYTLADGLWQYALSTIVLGIWHDRPWGWQKVGWALVPLLMGSLVELAQLAGLLAGTFDPWDVAGCVVASAAAVAVHGPPWRRSTQDRSQASPA